MRSRTSAGDRFGDFVAVYYCAEKHNWRWRCVHCHYTKTATAGQMRARTALRLCRECHRTILTPREQEIAALVGQGLSNKEIAHKLGIQRHTVAIMLTPVYAKLGITGRVQLAVWVTKENSKPTDN